LFTAVALATLLAAVPAQDESRHWLEQARAAFQSQDLPTARSAAEKALGANPRATEAEVILGLIDTAEANLASAQKHFSRAVSLEPNDYRTHAYLASTYLAQKRYADARRAFGKVLSLKPGNMAAQYNLGVIELAEHRPNAALPHFVAVHEADKTDVPAMVGMLNSQIAMKHDAEVARSVQDLQRLLPSGSPEMAALGATLAASGYDGLAIPLLTTARDSNSRSFEAAYNLSLALFHVGRLADALQAIRPWTSGDGRAEAYNLLGAIEEKQGHFSDATRAYDTAVRLAPENEDFRIDSAGVRATTGDFEGAAAGFAQAARDFPHAVRARLGLGAVEYLSGMYEDAARALMDAITIQPRQPVAFDLLGKTFESVPALQGEIKRLFERYLATKPREAAPYVHYGTMLYLAAGGDGPDRYREAKRYVSEALTREPTYAPAHFQLGVIAQTEGRLPDAAQAFERAIAVSPSYATPHYRLANVYKRLGQADRAAAELNRFQQLKAEDNERERATLLRSVTASR